jgi:serine protease Do
MTTSRSRHFLTLMLVVCAVLFGMVLAGGLELTLPGGADEGSAPGPAQVVGSGVDANGMPSFADLAEAVEPAVVSITAATFQTAPRRQMMDPFEFFFGPRRRGVPEPEGESEPEQQRFRSDAGGSGFVISADGLVVTNNHVVRGADRLTVRLDNRDFPAEVKGVDPATDLALLKIDAGRELSYLKLGDSDRLRVGDWVMAIGSPLALDHSVTVGVVSAKGRSNLGITDISFENFIQTDAAINFGNSGGPLVNLHGEVVGIATAINYGAENIGFAVPVSTLKQILPQLRESGKVSRGYLGIQIRNLDYTHAEAFGLESTDGALVESVESDSPAGKSGITHGDVIVGVDGREVEDTRNLIEYVSSQPPGSSVELEVLRNGKRSTHKVKLGERPGSATEAEAPSGKAEGGIEWLGLGYQNLDSSIRSSHGIPGDAHGVWITRIEPDSPLFEEGVQPGDVIAEVNGHEINGVDEFEQVVEDADEGSYLRFYVQRFDPRSGRAVAFFAPVRKP